MSNIHIVQYFPTELLKLWHILQNPKEYLYIIFPSSNNPMEKFV